METALYDRHLEVGRLAGREQQSGVEDRRDRRKDGLHRGAARLDRHSAAVLRLELQRTRQRIGFRQPQPQAVAEFGLDPLHRRAHQAAERADIVAPDIDLDGVHRRHFIARPAEGNPEISPRISRITRIGPRQSEFLTGDHGKHGDRTILLASVSSSKTSDGSYTHPCNP